LPDGVKGRNERERAPRMAGSRRASIGRGLRVTAPAIAVFLLLPTVARAAEFDGADLGLAWSLPFVGILLSIAVWPLVAPVFWHHHFGKISAAWALAVILPFTTTYGPGPTIHALALTALHEYLPFIILLFSLFTVTGGIHLRGAVRGTPAFNTGLLALGALLASWMGTTGAAMALVRPMLKANAWRPRRAHVVIFFIFLVANIGGSLSPLGDPPLFLGFLKGVPFFWPTLHLLWPMLFVAGILLAIFYVLDRYMLAKDGLTAADDRAEGKLRIDGAYNFVLLAGIVGAVLMSGLWQPEAGVSLLGVEVELQNLVRDLLLLLLAGLSWVLTPPEIREANEFSWFPIQEVAKLFAGIFVTIIPTIAILRAGTEGALAPVVRLVTDANGHPVNAMYFWATGILSSFLDNAPTYLVFFNTAGGDAEVLTGSMATTLLAVSAGAVFMGANTYIGNAPNFMVRAIAEESGVKMPSFFGYMAWSGLILLPCFALVTLLWFV